MDDYTYLAWRIKCRHPFCDSCVGCGDIDEYVFDCQNWRLFFDADDKPKTTVRTSRKNVDRPISCAESNGAVRFVISSLVAEILMDSHPIPRIADCFDFCR